jgi:hypothetical protein
MANIKIISINIITALLKIQTIEANRKVSLKNKRIKMVNKIVTRENHI